MQVSLANVIRKDEIWHPSFTHTSSKHFSRPLSFQKCAFMWGAERVVGKGVCVQVSQQLCEEHTCLWKSLVHQGLRPLHVSNCASSSSAVVRLQTPREWAWQAYRLSKPQVRGSLLLKGTIGFIQITETRSQWGPNPIIYFGNSVIRRISYQESYLCKDTGLLG